jgi:hypothetical protein
MFRVYGFHLLKYILFGAVACLAASQANADPFIVTLENKLLEDRLAKEDPASAATIELRENILSYSQTRVAYSQLVEF